MWILYLHKNLTSFPFIAFDLLSLPDYRVAQKVKSLSVCTFSIPVIEMSPTTATLQLYTITFPFVKVCK